MYTTVVKVADFIVEISHRYEYTRTLCNDYLYSGTEKAELFVSATEDDLCSEEAIAKEKHSRGFIESICIYRNLCLNLPQKDAFVMHGAAVAVDDKGYVFTAKSGTGKSTHALLWCELLPNRAAIINGDKPIIRKKDGKFVIYGTPWSGKEGFNQNTGKELFGVCFLERGEQNKISSLPKADSAMRIMNQILIPSTEEGVVKTFDLIDEMINKTKTYKLSCNVSLEAARMSYECMSGEKL